MQSPFTSPDPLVKKSAIILSFYSLFLLFFFGFLIVSEFETKTLQKQIILPIKAWYHTQISQIALDIANDARKKQEKSILLQELEKNKQMAKETYSIATSSSTIIINNSNKPAPKKNTNNNSINTPNLEVIISPPSTDGYNSNLSQPPSFDEAEWQRKIDQMKADSQARYEESLKNQQLWSKQKSAENAAWMDEQRAKAQAEQEKWKEENGF